MIRMGDSWASNSQSEDSEKEVSITAKVHRWRSTLPDTMAKNNSLDENDDTTEVSHHGWVPMTRNQRFRKPILPSSGQRVKTNGRGSRIQDWVNFNIKTFVENNNAHDSDSGFEQATNDFQSLYIEPWTDLHKPEPEGRESKRKSRARQPEGPKSLMEDRVRIYVSGPSPSVSRKKPYKSDPNDDRFYVSARDGAGPETSSSNNQHQIRRKKPLAPQPPKIANNHPYQSLNIANLKADLNNHLKEPQSLTTTTKPKPKKVANKPDPVLSKLLFDNVNDIPSSNLDGSNHKNNLKQRSIATMTEVESSGSGSNSSDPSGRKKTYYFSTSSNELAFPETSTTELNPSPVESPLRQSSSPMSNSTTSLDRATVKSSSISRNPDIPEPDYSPIPVRRTRPKHRNNNNDKNKRVNHRPKSSTVELTNLWGNAARYKGSLEDLDGSTGEESAPTTGGGKSGKNHGQLSENKKNPYVKEMIRRIRKQSSKDKKRQLERQAQDYGLTSLIGQHQQQRLSSRRSSSMDRNLNNQWNYTSMGHHQPIIHNNNHHILSDGISTLSLSSFDGNQQRNNSLNRMTQYDHNGSRSGRSTPLSWQGFTKANSMLSMNPDMDDGYDVLPMQRGREQAVLREAQSKQSHFFNSLFPSRANRFGFPVYPERSFGIPSQMSVPISFAGFSPEPNGTTHTQSMIYSSNHEDNRSDQESNSILSELPKILLGRKKKYSFTKKKTFLGLF